MFQKILVDCESFLSLAGLGPLRHKIQRPIPLLQKKNVGHYFRSRIGLECIVRQADSPQEFCSLGQISAYRRILCVHGIAGSNKRHYTARTYLIQCFGKKVIVNGKSQAIIRLVIDLILTKGDISHRKIIELPAVRCLKSRHRNICFWIKLPGNPPGNAVQFHTVQPALSHAFRQHTKKISHAAGRFQNVSLFKSHLFHCFINRADYRWAGIMGIQRRASGRFIFCRCQGFF